MKRFANLENLKTVFQWTLVIAIFTFLFKKYPPQEIWQSAKQAHWLPLCLASVAYFLVMGMLDTRGIQFIFSRFGGHSLRFSDLFKTRMASYLIQIVNYGAGQGSLAYFLAKKEEMPLWKTVRFIFFISLVDLYGIILVAFTGTLFVPPVLEGRNLQLVISTFWAAMTIVFAVMLLYPRVRLWAPVMEKIRLRDLFLILVIRFPIALILIVTFYFIPFFFDARIPLNRILTAMPIIHFLGALPLTPGGLGTSQIAFVGLLKSSLVTTQPVTAENLLLSMSLVWGCINYTLKMIGGTICLKLRRREMIQMAERARLATSSLQTAN